MKVKEQNVPVLRFPGFSGDWNIDRIKNYISRVGVAVNVEPEKLYREIGIRSHGRGLFHKEPVTGKSLGNKRVFEIHVPAFVVNIVFAWEHAIAVTSDNEKGFIASHRFPMFVPVDGKSSLPFVRYFFLRKYGKHLLGLASPGGAGRNKTLGQKNFDKLKVIFPEVDEQQKIAAFLTAVDSKIEQLSKKKALLEQYKKGMMQKFFPAKGETVPVLRFPGFDGEWDNKKLSEVNTQMQSGLSRLLKDDDIGLPVIRSNNIVGDKLDINDIKYWYREDPQGANIENYLLSEGDLLINFINSVAQIGKVALYDNKLGRDAIITTNLMRLKFSDEVELKFIFYFFLTEKYKLHIHSITKPAVNQASFTTKDLGKLLIPLPENTEQRKIADFLTSIDKKITLISTELNHAQAFKKALLQQMFA